MRRATSLSGMSAQLARNVAIIVLLALVVWLAPGGGEGADLVGKTLNAIFIVVTAMIVGILYRQYRGCLLYTSPSPRD